MAAIYTRVSSQQQDIELSTDSQIFSLKTRAEQDGFAIYEIFTDKGESGMSMDRPALQKMLALAKQSPPPFTRIYLWSVSRFSRDRVESAVFKQRLRRVASK